MEFRQVAETFALIEQETSRLKKTVLLAELLSQASSVEAAMISYLSLGRLRPIYLKEQFNFAEKSVVRLIAGMLGETEQIIKNKAASLGDLGDVLAVSHKVAPQQHVSIQEVNEELNGFLLIGGIGSQELKEQALYALLQLLDAVSAKYVVRIVLGKLRLGFSDMTLLDAFSWLLHGNKSIRKELEEAYNISADIGNIIKVLKEDGIKGIEKISITPGIPIRPAAAERLASAAAIVQKLGSCVAQSKLDGFRLQVHIDNSGNKPLIRFFSRNLQDMTDMFPDLAEAISHFAVKTLVFEGEAIAYDVETDTFLPFQETVKRRRKYDIEEMARSFPLRLFIFDLLYLDGRSCLSQSHSERRTLLEALFDNKKIVDANRVVPIQETKIMSAQALEDLFNDALAKGLEGLVVKREDAIYQAGKRNFNWIKLKRQESGELDDTIDCIILGYYFGKGKRAEFGIGSLLVGVFNYKEKLFQTIAKIGTGLSDEEWIGIKSRIDQKVLKAKPSDVVCAKELYPDVWAFPEIVCMIRADEITQSPLHTAGSNDERLGFALRFPRFMGYREDKSAYDITTVKEVQELYHLQFSRKAKGKAPQSKEKEPLEANLKIT